MVDLHTAAFIFMVLGLVIFPSWLSYLWGRDDEKEKHQLRQQQKNAQQPWRIVQVPRDAHTVVFHIRHFQYWAGHREDGYTHQVTMAKIADEEDLARAKAKAERRCEDFNSRELTAGR